MPKKSLVIDVHHHWIPDEHYRRPELHVHQDEEVIHEADRFRIRRAGVQLFSPPRMTARMDEQLKAMDRAGVDQAALHVGVWLDWVDIKAACHLDVPILVHPASELPLAHPHGMEQFNLTRNLGRAMDTTINIARLMLSGTMDRFPQLRFVFSHMGGAFFALKNRINPAFWAKRDKRFFDKYKKRIFVDTAPPFWSPEEIGVSVKTMGESQVLMGSDFPTIDQLKNAVTIIQKARATAQVKKKVMGDNARKLFGRR